MFISCKKNKLVKSHTSRMQTIENLFANRLQNRSMGHLLKCIFFTGVYLCLFSFHSCSISYKMNGANINYQTTHTISIADFPNNAPLVNPTLSNALSEGIRDLFQRQTRLQMLRKGGDLEIEGEITGYTVTQGAISADGYASESKLTITISVHFTNNVNPEDSFDKTYTSYQTFNSNMLLTDVQDELCTAMITEFAENIFNDTVARW